MAKVNLLVQPGDELQVSDDVAAQLLKSSQQFKDAPASEPAPEPADEDDDEATTRKPRKRTAKRTPSTK